MDRAAPHDHRHRPEERPLPSHRRRQRLQPLGRPRRGHRRRRRRDLPRHPHRPLRRPRPRARRRHTGELRSAELTYCWDPDGPNNRADSPAPTTATTSTSGGTDDRDDSVSVWSQWLRRVRCASDRVDGSPRGSSASPGLPAAASHGGFAGPAGGQTRRRQLRGHHRRRGSRGSSLAASSSDSVGDLSRALVTQFELLAPALDPAARLLLFLCHAIAPLGLAEPDCTYRRSPVGEAICAICDPRLTPRLPPGPPAHLRTAGRATRRQRPPLPLSARCSQSRERHGPERLDEVYLLVATEHGATIVVAADGRPVVWCTFAARVVPICSAQHRSPPTLGGIAWRLMAGRSHCGDGSRG